MNKDIRAYNALQSKDDKKICEALMKHIELHLPGAESKIWHGHPVWFLGGNPIVGYNKLKDRVRILFWSGQSFEEKGLIPEGTFKAAEASYTNADQIHSAEIKRWLLKSKKIQWDYKNIVKRKGKLIRIEDFSMLSTPARRALANEKITTLETLSTYTERDILALHGIGPSTLPPLRIALKKAGYSFKK